MLFLIFLSFFFLIFLEILSTVSKISKRATLRFSESQLVLTHHERATGGGTNLWVEINQTDYFDEYRIEGKDDRNEIYLEVINENLVRAMKSGQHAQSIKIKLTKKRTPCLTFEITLPSLTLHTRNVVHDVPVEVIPSRFWDDFQKPILPNYDIMSANRNGDFRFTVETDEATVTSHFKNMEIEHENDSNEESDSMNDNNIEARIDISKLATFLHIQQFNPTKVLCGLVTGQTVHLFMHCHDVSFQYFIPAMNATMY